MTKTTNNISDMSLAQQEDIEAHKVKCFARYVYNKCFGNTPMIAEYLKNRKEPRDSKLRIELRELVRANR